MASEDMKNGQKQLSTLRFNRRQLMVGASALGVSATMLPGMMAPELTAAQSQTPYGPQGQALAGGRSMNRDEFQKALAEHFKLEKATDTTGQFIWADVTDISTINGILSADLPTAYVVGYIFETLTGGNPWNGWPTAPGLADYYELSKDGTTYTFHLNPNVKWHDGQPFTADDVKFSFDMGLNPDTGSQYASAAKDNIASYRVVDPHTFELKSKGPRAFFIFNSVSVFPIMPQHIWKDVPAKAWKSDPGSTGKDPKRVVGTGPFKFKEWVQGDHVTVLRNDDYYDVKPNVAQITFRVLPDSAAAVESLKKGEIDLFGIEPSQVADVKDTQGLKVTTYDTFDFGWWAYNLDPTKTKVFQDKQVRQALFTALDREAIIEKIFFGFGEVAIGTQPKLSPAYDPSAIKNPYKYSIDDAKKLLADAGWKDTDGSGVVQKNGQKLEFEMVYSQGVLSYSRLLPYLQQQWKLIGAKMTPKAVPFPTLVQMLEDTHEYDTLLLGFSWDASGDQSAMFATDQYNGGFNTMKYSNPKYDALNKQAQVEMDPDKRRQLLIQMSQIVWDDQPVAIYRFGQSNTAYSDQLHNVFVNDYSWAWSHTYLFPTK